MQGFPPDFIFPNSEKQAMKQLGNSIVIPAIQDYAEKIVKAL
jgi:DNA (cytosine-5)-methyltransferase 1